MSLPEPEQQNFQNLDQNLDQLPPETRQKFEEAMSKLKGNPGIFQVMGALGNLAKTANEIGITQITGKNNIKAMTQLHERISGKTTQRSPESISNYGTASQPTGQATSSIVSTNSSSNHYASRNTARSIQPTFNPDVKGDTTRAKIAILGILIVVGYFIFQFGFHGQIPQEIIDFLNS